MSDSTPQRNVIALLPEACTSCMVCVRECPSWCISVESHVEEVSEEGARRPRTVNVLDEFTIDYGLCMYCGICIETCPFDALAWRDSFDYSSGDRRGLQQDAVDLSRWWPTGN